MRITAVPESLGEVVALSAGRIPLPLVQTFQAALLARAIMVATRVGLFEALARGSGSRESIAQQCGCHAGATGHLLEALVGSGYVERDVLGYALGPVARQWLLTSSPHSVRHKVLFQFVEWRAMDGFETYLREGRSSPLHEQMCPDEWTDYQRAMQGFAQSRGPEIVNVVPLPAAARDMLDVGGGHGAIACAFCRRHPELRATVLDLPEAIAAAAPLLASEGLGERVVHRAADARSAVLGDSCWDIVYVGQLTHHLGEAENRRLFLRAARSLRPGGVLVICDAVPGRPSQASCLADLFGAVASGSAAWSADCMRGWMRTAALRYRRVPLGSGVQALYLGTKG